LCLSRDKTVLYRYEQDPGLFLNWIEQGLYWDVPNCLNHTVDLTARFLTG
jgi:hypothetical protein